MVAPTVLDVRLPRALAPAELERACACLAARLRTGPVGAVVCHAESLADDLPAVEALARLSLVARRGGARFVVRGPSPELASLAELLGLGELLATSDGPAQVSGPVPAGHWDGGRSVRTVSPQAHSDRRGGAR